MSKTHIIIGTSAAGIGAFNKLRQLDPQAEIICISQEKELPYNKCFLAEYLGNIKLLDSIYTVKQPLPPTFLLGTKVTHINPADKRLHLSDGQMLSYNSLFLGLGTHALRPPIPGIELEGVFTFHTLADTQAIIDYIARYHVKQAVVIGAGLSGLEAADALLAHGVQVSVVEQKSQVLPAHVDLQGSQLIQAAMEAHKVALYGSERVTQILGASDRVIGVQLAGGGQLPADLVIVAIGARPNTSLAAQAGLEMQGGGIVTMPTLATSIQDIYAGGDVALVNDQLTAQKVLNGTWPDAMLQGMMAAHAMAGQPKTYPGVLVVVSSSFFGVKFASCGLVVSPSGSCEVIAGIGEQGYQKILLEAGHIKGFLLVGPRLANLGILRRAALTRELMTPEAIANLIKS